jgi:hypothetical protein
VVLYSPPILPAYAADYLPGGSVRDAVGNALAGSGVVAVGAEESPEFDWLFAPTALLRGCLGFRVKMVDANIKIRANILRCLGGDLAVREIQADLLLFELVRFGVPGISDLSGALNLRGELSIAGNGEYLSALDWSITPESNALNATFIGLGARRVDGRWVLQR